jgi:multidrug efflux pump subunit AcrB
MAATVTFRDDTPPDRVPDLFYLTRKTLDDLRPSLPQGVLGPQVNDEYGDVYSVLYMLTTDGLGLDRLKDFGEDMRQQLLGVPGVAKVDLIGTQGERIFVEFSHVKLATLGISPQVIFDSLARQNAVAPAGAFETGATSIPLRITGALDGVAAVEAVPVAIGDRVFRLGDIATVTRGLTDPPSSLVREDGRPAIGVGISMVENGNIIALGKALDAAMAAIEADLPVAGSRGARARNPQPRRGSSGRAG